MERIGNPNVMLARSKCLKKDCDPQLVQGSASAVVDGARRHEAWNPGHTVRVEFYGSTLEEFLKEENPTQNP